MSEFDRQKWETRYRDGRGYEASAHPFLDDVVAAHLPPEGRALDLAGGTGRHARWLARRGLDVTLADISPTALANATRRAADEGLTLVPCEIDLDDGVPEGPWDVVLISFFLATRQMDAIVASLAPGGLVVWIHPTRQNLERHDKPSAGWLLADGALDRGVPGLVTVHHREGWTDQDRHEVHYVGRKPYSGTSQG